MTDLYSSCFTVQGVGNTAGQTVQGATDTVGGATQGAGQAVGGVTDQATDTVGGATGVGGQQGQQNAQNPLGLSS